MRHLFGSKSPWLTLLCISVVLLGALCFHRCRLSKVCFRTLACFTAGVFPRSGETTAPPVLIKFFVHLTLAIAPNETAQKVLSIELGGSSNGQF
jgi:hypothetical protein